MHGMVNITLSPETYDIELRRRPIVSTASGRFSSNAVCNGTQHAWRPLWVTSDRLTVVSMSPLIPR
jgi:hypothetical protein